MLTHTPYKGDSVANTLTQQRKQSEVGPNHNSHPRPHNGASPHLSAPGGTTDSALGNGAADGSAPEKLRKGKGMKLAGRGAKRNNNNQKKEGGNLRKAGRNRRSRKSKV